MYMQLQNKKLYFWSMYFVIIRTFFGFNFSFNYTKSLLSCQDQPSCCILSCVFSFISEGYKQPYFIHKQISCIAEDDDYVSAVLYIMLYFFRVPNISSVRR